MDSLVHQFSLRAPFLIKLDIQGAELAVLEGACETLKETDVLICEVDLADFHHLDRVMHEEGSLFDITELRRLADQSLSWFYPIYVNRRLDRVRNRTLWDPSLDQAVTEMQHKRREQVLEYNARVLAEIRQARGART